MLLCSSSIWKVLVMPCLHPYLMLGVILRCSKRQSWSYHAKPLCQSSGSEG